MSPEMVDYFPPPFFDPASVGPAQLWMGSGPNRISTPLHRDSGDAFLGQLIGRKRFKLYSPDQTLYLYVFKSYNRDQPCWVNPWEPDFKRFPLFSEAFATEFILEPGELLIIPRGWYHTVMALDRTLSVGFHREPVTDFGRMLRCPQAE
jgi:ribosomal protein L16 Arg81 hydroxylase